MLISDTFVSVLQTWLRALDASAVLYVGPRRLELARALGTDVHLVLPEEAAAAGHESVPLGAAVIEDVGGTERDVRATLRTLHGLLASQARIIVLHSNARHFSDFVAWFASGSLPVDLPMPVGELADVLAEQGFADIRTIPVRLGYGPAADPGSSGHELDGEKVSDPTRQQLLSHATIVEAAVIEDYKEPYDVERLQALWDEGNLTEAASYLNTHLSQSPNRSSIWSDAAAVMQAAGMLDDALRCVRRSLVLDPLNPIARDNLQTLLDDEPEPKSPPQVLWEWDPTELLAGVERDLVQHNYEGALAKAEVAAMLRPDPGSIEVLADVLRCMGGEHRAADVERLKKVVAAACHGSYEHD